MVQKVRLILGTFLKISKNKSEKVESQLFRFWRAVQKIFENFWKKCDFCFRKVLSDQIKKIFGAKLFRRNYFSGFREQQRSLARRAFSDF